MALMGQRKSGGGGGTESAAGRPSPHASEAGAHVASWGVTDVASVQFLFGHSGLWAGGLVMISSISTTYLLSSCEIT